MNVECKFVDGKCITCGDPPSTYRGRITRRGCKSIAPPPAAGPPKVKKTLRFFELPGGRDKCDHRGNTRVIESEVCGDATIFVQVADCAYLNQICTAARRFVNKAHVPTCVDCKYHCAAESADKSEGA